MNDDPSITSGVDLQHDTLSFPISPNVPSGELFFLSVTNYTPFTFTLAILAMRFGLRITMRSAHSCPVVLK